MCALFTHSVRTHTAHLALDPDGTSHDAVIFYKELTDAIRENRPRAGPLLPAVSASVVTAQVDERSKTSAGRPALE
jgi:hypothetical protein